MPTIQPTWDTVPPSVLAYLRAGTYRQFRMMLCNLEMPHLQELDRAVTDEIFTRLRPVKKQRMVRRKAKPEKAPHPRRAATQTEPDVIEHIAYGHGLARGKKYHLACFASSLEKEMPRYWERPCHSQDCHAKDKCAACGKPLKQKASVKS